MDLNRSVWSTKDIDKLIQLVKANPDIYDRSKPGHSNVNSIDITWKIIANEIGTKTDAECKSKWQILRSSYRQRRNFIVSVPPGINTSKKKQWAYYKALSFLEPFLKKFDSNTKSDDASCDTGPNEDDQENEESTFNAFNSNDSTFFIKEENDLEYSNDSQSFQNIPNNDEDNFMDAKDEATPTQNNFASDNNLNQASSNNNVTANNFRNIESEFIKTILRDYLRTRQNKRTPVQSFFDSIEMDTEKLTPSQFRTFRIKVLNLLDSMLSENE